MKITVGRLLELFLCWGREEKSHAEMFLREQFNVFDMRNFLFPFRSYSLVLIRLTFWLYIFWFCLKFFQRNLACEAEKPPLVFLRSLSRRWVSLIFPISRFSQIVINFQCSHKEKYFTRWYTIFTLQYFICRHNRLMKFSKIASWISDEKFNFHQLKTIIGQNLGKFEIPKLINTSYIFVIFLLDIFTLLLSFFKRFLIPLKFENFKKITIDVCDISTNMICNVWIFQTQIPCRFLWHHTCTQFPLVFQPTCWENCKNRQTLSQGYFLFIVINFRMVSRSQLTSYHCLNARQDQVTDCITVVPSIFFIPGCCELYVQYPQTWFVMFGYFRLKHLTDFYSIIDVLIVLNLLWYFNKLAERTVRIGKLVFLFDFRSPMITRVKIVGLTLNL